MDSKRSLFIVVEGIDGVGKTTCSRMLAEMIGGHYYKTPPPMFEQVRAKIDLAGDLMTRFLFYLTTLSVASTEIKNLLEAKKVLCDRFVCSTIAYHRALGVDTSFIDFHKLPLISPDFTFYLWAREEVIRQRICGRGLKSLSDEWLEKDRELQARIHEEFLSFPVHDIDTSDLTPEEVCKKIIAITS
jgi:dTMP kinase